MIVDLAVCVSHPIFARYLQVKATTIKAALSFAKFVNWTAELCWFFSVLCSLLCFALSLWIFAYDWMLTCGHEVIFVWKSHAQDCERQLSKYLNSCSCKDCFFFKYIGNLRLCLVYHCSHMTEKHSTLVLHWTDLSDPYTEVCDGACKVIKE